MDNLVLLPQPRALTFTSEQHQLGAGQFIFLQAAETSQLLFTAKTLQTTLQQVANLSYPLSAVLAGAAKETGIILRLNAANGLPEQGYKLEIAPSQIIAEAAAPVGLFYAVNTLCQLIKQSGPLLPCLTISDWPDFAVRGFMLDVSRDKVPTLATIFSLVDKLASWKINQIQLYTEHTFAYLNHPEVWQNASPLSGQDILELDAYCKERFIELVPNQNTFGHMHRWLEHSRYADLAEVTDGFMTPWGYQPGTFSLNPTNPASFELVKELFDELLPHFSSRTVNIGCDETFDLGQGKSKEQCELRGKGRVYLEFLKQVSSHLIARGYQVQFWGDIILEHPELFLEIPKGVIALDWGYEENHPFAAECSKFQAAGVPFYVCPGTSSWCSLTGRTQNSIGNLQSAAEAGLQYGATGYLITDWGDLGHWQPLSVSYLGIMVGAAFAWSVEANRALDVPTALNRHVFEDAANVMGSLVYDLGNLYQLPGLSRHNGSQLFWLLKYSDEQLKKVQQNPENSNETLLEVLNWIDRTLPALEKSRMLSPEAELIKKEIQLSADMTRLACLRGLVALGKSQYESEFREQLGNILEEYKVVWLSRNRPGGLTDSIKDLLKLQV